MYSMVSTWYTYINIVQNLYIRILFKCFVEFFSKWIYVKRMRKIIEKFHSRNRFSNITHEAVIKTFDSYCIESYKFFPQCRNTLLTEVAKKNTCNLILIGRIRLSNHGHPPPSGSPPSLHHPSFSHWILPSSKCVN